MPIDQNRIEEMLELVSSENKEGHLPSSIASLLRSMEPTKEEAEAASRIARNRELESANMTTALEQKRAQLIKAMDAIDLKDIDAAVKQKVAIGGELKVVDGLLEDDKAKFKPTYKTDMIFAAVEAIKVRSILSDKIEELDAMIVKSAGLWNEIRSLAHKGQSSVSEFTGRHNLHDYVDSKTRHLTH